MEKQSGKNKRLTLVAISIGVLIAIAALFYLIFNIDGLRKIFAPVMTGLVMAFLLNPILKFYENRIFAWKKTTQLRRNLCMAFSIVMTFITGAAIIVLVFMLIVPQLVDSVSQLVANKEQYLDNLTDIINDAVNAVKKFFSGDSSYEYKEVIADGRLEEYFKGLFAKGEDGSDSTALSSMLQNIWPMIQRIGIGIYDAIKNVLIGLFLAFYILISKDLRRAQFRKFRKAFLSPEQDEFLVSSIKIANKNFNGFIKGKILDSLIIGLLAYVLFEVFSISEYNILNATIVGITNIIPVFGPIIGAIPVAFVVLISNPSKFLLVLILILLIQQLDGNVIGPKILGDATNVSALTVIIAICTMGSILGIFGMIIGVPLFATIIAIVKKLAEKRLVEKGAPTDTEAYFSGRTLIDPHRLAHKDEHTWIYRYEHSDIKVRVDLFLSKFKRKKKRSRKKHGKTDK